MLVKPKVGKVARNMGYYQFLASVPRTYFMASIVDVIAIKGLLR